MKLKDISIIASLGFLAISVIASAAVLKKTTEENKKDIEDLKKSQIEYRVQQEVIKERTENIQKSIDKLEKSIEEGQEILLEEIKKKRR